jgi:hypothetical protein
MAGERNFLDRLDGCIQAADGQNAQDRISKRLVLDDHEVLSHRDRRESDRPLFIAQSSRAAGMKILR